MKLFGSESSKYHLKVCIYKHIKESKIWSFNFFFFF
jgi:hypothetical protein